MSDMVAFSGQGGQAGQPAQPATPPAQPDATPQTSPAGQQQAAPDEFTPGQLQQIAKVVAQSLAQTQEQLRRQQQSLLAKQENRIKQQVQQQLETLKAAGVQVAPEQARAIENAVRQQQSQQPEIDPEQPGTPGAAAQPQPGAQPGAPVDPIDAAAYAMMESLGVGLEHNDPEAATLDRSSPQAYLKSIHTALMAKKARIETAPAARIPAGGGGSPASTALPDDPDALWQMAKEQMKKGR